jgi:hypothetical protein
MPYNWERGKLQVPASRLAGPPGALVLRVDSKPFQVIIIVPYTLTPSSPR